VLRRPGAGTSDRGGGGSFVRLAATARGRGGAGAGLVFKDRITPRWFADNTRFWYRNDLANRGKEFVLVDAEKGTREPAFDHARLAASLSKATGSEVRSDRLPFDEIAYIDDARAIKFKVGDSTWKCVLASYECSKTDEAPPEAPAATEPGALQRQRRGEGGEGPSRDRIKSPDGKWTAFIKDHDVYARSEPDGKETRLSDDGKENLTYTRLSWSPDSQSLVAFRVEPDEDLEVHLVQSSRPAAAGPSSSRGLTRCPATSSRATS